MVLEELLLQQKDSYLLGNSFSMTRLFKTQMGSMHKKYWNVAIFKLRLLSDQSTYCEYAQFRGKMTQAPMVVRKTRFIAKRYIP